MIGNYKNFIEEPSICTYIYYQYIDLLIYIINLAIKTIRKYFRKFKVLGGEFYSRLLKNVVLDGSVEIDECCKKLSKIFNFYFLFILGITSKRKGLIGRFPGNLIWVFGLFERRRKIFKVFMVPNRRSATIFPIIRENIEKDSMIISDSFSVYVSSRRKLSRFLK